jgi:hypothetical protein
VGFKDSTDYVGEMMDLVKTGPAKGDAVGTPYFIRFGGEDFAAQDCAITVAGQAARESINAAFLRGYAFIITAAYSNDAGRRRAQEILEAARFEPMKAGGWDGSASRLEERRRELEKAWGAATKPGGVARDKLARAKRRRAPDWTRKSAWREEYGGKSYVFGVGVARSIISPALRIDAAESRARSSIAAMSAAATVEEKMSGDGREAGRIIRSSADETLANVAAVDWYSDADGRAFYALVVETP